MTSPGVPITPDEAGRLFGSLGLAAGPPCALAVSGGADSTALMVLFAEWLRVNGQHPGRHTVLTVDHGLRPESGAEARAVAAKAAHLGFGCAVLAWHAPKPQTGIQEAARHARYSLLARYMRVNGISVLLTAHTLDDQAETVLMRLARGSGVDGLAAMAPKTPLVDVDDCRGADAGGLEIIRPLLGVAKTRLVATLETRNVDWIEDPSNETLAFERTRLRAASARLAEIGLTGEMLGLSAMRLRRAREALEGVADRFCAPGATNVVVEPWGRIVVALEPLRAKAEEIALRVLARAISAAGGAGGRVPMAKLEQIVTALLQGGAQTWTLSRAIVSVDARAVTIEREPGRVPPPHMSLLPGSSLLWDGRFRIQIELPMSARPVEVRALGAEGLANLRSGAFLLPAAPARAAALVPGIWQGDTLIAVPSLGFWETPALRDRVRAEFTGIRPHGASRPS